ncbi:MAG: PP2C family protein-serine/threonine phosphatase [Clostridium sp.]
MNFLIGYDTDIGLRKSGNQDALVIKTARSPYGRIGLFAVCDGMGGLADGHLASASVVSGLKAWFDKEVRYINFNNLSDSDILFLVNKKIEEINLRVKDYGENKGVSLGTTLTMIFSINDRGFIFQSGDSRAYKIKNGVEQITRDQSYIQREIERGNLTVEESRNHPKKNILLGCIGVKEDIDIDMKSLKVNEGEVYLICSDGLYRKLYDDEICECFTLNNYATLEEINARIKGAINMVKSRKERDNITAIVFKVVK